MKRTIYYSFFLLLGSACFVQCSKTLPALTGDASQAAFEFTQPGKSDTLPYTAVINFENKSAGEFLYQWDFGDNSGLSSQKNPVHTYPLGGIYDVRLTTVGTNGNNSVTKKVFAADACSVAAFKALTNCGAGEWTWSNDADAIRVLSPDGTQVYFAGTAAGCQVDDVYKFSADGKFGYDANGQTFDVQSGYSCQAAKANATTFKMVAKNGQLPKILLGNTTGGASKPFIGTTDEVDNNTYEIVTVDENVLVLRAVLSGSGGALLEIKLKKVKELTLADIRNILTGGSSKSWKLNPATGSIIVGTESNPAEYFGGGGLEACQLDDVYTFSVDNKLTYKANGATFNGGNIAPNYNCGDDRSYTNLAYTFTAVAGGRAGVANIQLPGIPPNPFIGTTDVPAENTYRIIEITPTAMVLRAGNGSGTIFQFKFIAL